MAVTAVDAQAPRDRYALGRLDGFYRNSAAQAQTTAADQHLKEIPDYWFNNDFAYQSRGTDREVPFADRLSFVRPLGGWRSLPLGSPNPQPLTGQDVVTRDADGRLRYDFDRLWTELDPYVRDAGYRDIVFALDNTPWSLVDNPQTGFYGQVNAPTRMAEWEQVVGRTVRELRDRYGADVVSNWTLRMGTEYNNREFFNADQGAFEEMYDRAYRAAQAEVPGIKFGPTEVSGFSAIRDDLVSDFHNVSLFRLASHQFDGERPGGAASGVPVPAAGTMDHVAASMHFVPRYNDQGQLVQIDPQERVTATVDAFHRLADAHPELSDGAVPWEIHQFGVLQSEQTGTDGRPLPTTEPGARGAAQNLHALIEFKRQGVDSVWHWNVTEKVRGGTAEDQELIDGNGWTMMVLDELRDGQAFVLSTDTGGPLGGPDPSRDHVSEAGTQYKAMGVVKEDEGVAYVLVSAFNVDRFADDVQALDVFLPKGDFHIVGESVLHTALTADTALYDVIRADLEREGLLDEDYLAVPGQVASLALMAGDDANSRFAGRQYVGRNWETYTALFGDSLTLGATPAEVREFANVFRLRSDVGADEVHVFRFNIAAIPEPAGGLGLLALVVWSSGRRRRVSVTTRGRE